MNNLNSVLLEGILVSKGVITDNSIEFKIESTRYYNSYGEKKEKLTNVILVTVVAFNKEAEKVNKTVVGDLIRVVGRLDVYNDTGKLYIYAETIEIKLQSHNIVLENNKE